MKKITFNSPVVLCFALISAGALAASMITGGRSNILLFSVYKGSFRDPLFYLRLFTHVFGHAGISHYCNNMILILLVGPLLEEKYGSGRLAGIIAAVAFITGVVHILLPGNSALLGASGVVFAFILLSSVTGSGKGIPVTTIIVALIYITQQVYEGVAMADNVSQLTHIIGGTIGAVYGLSMKRK
ncbi:MAG: rhomboid family intramembrane serine protease [Solobacterium sp.]|nr:rhomboid family intramembrane serine protease [Solobacterium sp.]